jgi:hypothetical protein
LLLYSSPLPSSFSLSLSLNTKSLFFRYPEIISHFFPILRPLYLATTLPPMDQIVSVIRRCLPLCFPLPESEYPNEACKDLVVEDPNKDGNVFTALTDQIQMGRCMHTYLCVMAGFSPEKVTLKDRVNWLVLYKIEWSNMAWFKIPTISLKL